jgi:hypothetical protein
MDKMAFTPLDTEELGRVTGGMTPASAFKVLTYTKEMGRSAVTEQPFYKAQEEAKTHKAQADWKEANPNWQANLQGNPFAPKGPAVPAGLAAQKANAFPGHPQCSKPK